MAWRLARSLVKLREQIDTAHPNRSKISDGSIGDTRHSARKSDHNPNERGIVTAVDLTHDPAHGVDGNILSRQLASDPRVKYIIWSGSIFRSYKPELGWAKYTGPNRHDHHVHVSVLAGKANDDSAWVLGDPLPFRVTLRRGSKGVAVRLLQEKLHIPIDGQFGLGTLKAVEAFQRKHGLQVDGVFGAASWRALGLK